MSGIVPDAYPDYPGDIPANTNPGEDVPDWDERHDGYSVEHERSVVVSSRSGYHRISFTAAIAGLKITPETSGVVTLRHGGPGTLEVLEALHAVVTESLKRERDLLVSRERRESGPPPD